MKSYSGHLHHVPKTLYLIIMILAQGFARYFVHKIALLYKMHLSDTMLCAKTTLFEI